MSRHSRFFGGLLLAGTVIVGCGGADRNGEPAGKTDGVQGDSACNAWAARVDAEIAKVQACTSADDCRLHLFGLDYPGAACDLVVRTGAETSELRALVEAKPITACEVRLETTCPYTDGVLCEAGKCAHRYVDEPVCSSAKLARLCVRGTAQADGESLAAGDQLRIQVFPEGCSPSSSTFVGNSECKVERSGENFTATGDICLGSVTTPGGNFTSDCGGGRFAECTLDAALTEGEHTVTLDDQSLTFQVPSTLAFGGACVGKQY